MDCVSQVCRTSAAGKHYSFIKRQGVSQPSGRNEGDPLFNEAGALREWAVSGGQWAVRQKAEARFLALWPSSLMQGRQAHDPRTHTKYALKFVRVISLNFVAFRGSCSLCHSK